MLCGGHEECRSAEALTALAPFLRLHGLSLDIIHAGEIERASTPSGMPSTHARALHADAQEMLGSNVGLRHRAFQPNAASPSGLMSIGRRTMPIETAYASKGAHGGRYLQHATLEAPGLGSASMKYHVVLRNDTAVLEDRPEILKIECPPDSNELRILSAAPISLVPGQHMSFEAGWGCSQRTMPGARTVSNLLAKALIGGSTEPSSAKGAQRTRISLSNVPESQTVIVLGSSDSEPVEISDRDWTHAGPQSRTWATTATVEIVPPNNAASLFDLNINVSPSQGDAELGREQSNGTGTTLADRMMRGRRRRTQSCQEARGDLSITSLEALVNYDCSNALTTWDFNLDADTGDAIESPLSLVPDVMYFEDT